MPISNWLVGRQWVIFLIEANKRKSVSDLQSFKTKHFLIATLSSIVFPTINNSFCMLETVETGQLSLLIISAHTMKTIYCLYPVSLHFDPETHKLSVTAHIPCAGMPSFTCKSLSKFKASCCGYRSI